MTSHSSEETKKIAEQCIDRLVSGPKNSGATVVGLYGDLGSGKTTFTHYLAVKLGVTENVVSPTFIIMKSCELKAKNWKVLYHIDAYRLEDAKGMEKLGWKEIIENPEHLVVIEWPERIEKILPKEHMRINFTFIDDTTREITLP